MDLENEGLVERDAKKPTQVVGRFRR